MLTIEKLLAEAENIRTELSLLEQRQGTVAVLRTSLQMAEAELGKSIRILSSMGILAEKTANTCKGFEKICDRTTTLKHGYCHSCFMRKQYASWPEEKKVQLRGHLKAIRSKQKSSVVMPSPDPAPDEIVYAIAPKQFSTGTEKPVYDVTPEPELPVAEPYTVIVEDTKVEDTKAADLPAAREWLNEFLMSCGGTSTVHEINKAARLAGHRTSNLPYHAGKLGVTIYEHKGARTWSLPGHMITEEPPQLVDDPEPLPELVAESIADAVSVLPNTVIEVEPDYIPTLPMPTCNIHDILNNTTLRNQLQGTRAKAIRDVKCIEAGVCTIAWEWFEQGQYRTWDCVFLAWETPSTDAGFIELLRRRGNEWISETGGGVVVGRV